MPILSVEHTSLTILLSKYSVLDITQCVGNLVISFIQSAFKTTSANNEHAQN